MAKGPYDPDVYRRFAENLRAALQGPNVETLSMRSLRNRALAGARRRARAK